MNVLQLTLLVWLGINATLLLLFGGAILRLLFKPALARSRVRLARVLRP
ncbi:hypothetical protein [Deinococcus sp.]|nr:hypothetical protein [Deinococcus sp.]